MDRYIFIFIFLWGFLFGKDVTVIATGDMHGRLDKFAMLASVIRKYPSAVKIDLGDFSQGDFYSVSGNGFPVLDAFNSLSYDVLVLGNHDLEYPEKVLDLWQKHFRGSIMGGQWRLGDFRPLSGIVIKRDGVKIGIIALGESGLKKKSGLWASLHYDDEVKVLRGALESISAENCDILLLVCHISVGNFKILSRILREIPEIDAVIGAHSHREVAGRVFRNHHLAQPGAYGGSAVKMVFSIEGDRVKYISSRLLRPGDKADKEILEIAKSAEKNSAPEKIVSNAGTVEKFGQQAAEAVRISAGANVALLYLKTMCFSSPVTKKTLFEMLPYGNRIAVIKIPGNEFCKAVKKLSYSAGGIFISGNLERAEISLAMSDHMYFSNRSFHKYPVVITDKFERKEIEKAFENGEYCKKIPEKVENSASGIKL